MVATWQAFLANESTYHTLPRGTFLLVLGVDHNVSGKASYGNVVVEAVPPDAGFANRSCNGLAGIDSRSYGGSAAPFAPSSLPEASSLFAVHISRDCGPLTAAAAPTEIICLPVACGALVRHCDTLRVVTRAYLERATTTGPAYEELAWPRVVEFRASSRLTKTPVLS